MAIIKPFKALRPQAQFAKQVASKPYDVLNRKEARLDAAGNPNSFLHITRSEIDLPDAINEHDSQVYEKAHENLDAFIKRNVLFKEDKDCYYVYRLIMDGREQTGLVTVSSVDDYENDVIKKHELTREEKERDRINHIRVTGAQTGNVFLAYRNVAQIDEIINDWTLKKAPVYDLKTEDEVQHTVWIITDNEVIEHLTEFFNTKVPCTYIADGHHRAASAAKVRNNLEGVVTKEANYFLTTLFPASQLKIMDYNRLVKDLAGYRFEEFLEEVGKKFSISSNGSVPYHPQAPHEFGMYYNKVWYCLKAKPGTYSDSPIGVLDVSILQENLLEPLLKIKDPRTDGRIDFCGGIRGLSELESRVDSGEMEIAFALYPVSIEQLFDIADDGSQMPPKSTWFEPKLRDGLLTHVIYE